ncbi:prephenate dehydrogenase [Planctomycetales bacterium]|nr:prephenate dehydrogenase [Planctomycetales bacterium]
MFSRVVIIGIGLIGGSVGLAVKQRCLAGSVVGIDTNIRNLEEAKKLGAVDEFTADLETGINLGAGIAAPENTVPDTGAYTASSLPGAELLIIAVPVSFIADYVQRAAAAVKTGINYRNILITDTGSTKETICTQLGQIVLPNGCRYIGSHPIAGKETSGVVNADAHLFEDKLTVVTPVNSSKDRDIGSLIRFWSALGAFVANMSPSEHDRTLARTSHLPHILSALLADRLQLDDAKYTGTGYRSTTRLASGMPAIWRDIISNNKDAILESIRDFESALNGLREKIEAQNWDAVAQFLEHAKQNRDNLDETI